jgi:hypothetical protein
LPSARRCLELADVPRSGSTSRGGGGTDPVHEAQMPRRTSRARDLLAGEHQRPAMNFQGRRPGTGPVEQDPWFDTVTPRRLQISSVSSLSMSCRVMTARWARAGPRWPLDDRPGLDALRQPSGFLRPGPGRLLPCCAGSGPG